jgi:hypothetical protein
VLLEVKKFGEDIFFEAESNDTVEDVVAVEGIGVWVKRRPMFIMVSTGGCAEPGKVMWWHSSCSSEERRGSAQRK